MTEALLRVASWNCAGAFREKVDRALSLDSDVYVIQEAEPLEKYEHLLPEGCSTYFTKRPEFTKGILVFTRPGHGLRFTSPAHLRSDFAHVEPMTVTTPTSHEVRLWAVWTLDARPREAAYVGQAHLALDSLEQSIRPGTVMIGDFNSNAIWDHERRRHHSALIDRLGAHGLVSAYHSATGEPQGAETVPTFFLQRNASKPFHIDHCFTDLPVVDVEIGSFADWSGLKAAGGASDHVPLVVTVALC